MPLEYFSYSHHVSSPHEYMVNSFVSSKFCRTGRNCLAVYRIRSVFSPPTPLPPSPFAHPSRGKPLWKSCKYACMEAPYGNLASTHVWTALWEYCKHACMETTYGNLASTHVWKPLWKSCKHACMETPTGVLQARMYGKPYGNIASTHVWKPLMEILHARMYGKPYGNPASTHVWKPWVIGLGSGFCAKMLSPHPVQGASVIFIFHFSFFIPVGIPINFHVCIFITYLVECIFFSFDSGWL
ncbi:unnamed protein product, partial [Laminaria digitata]